MDEEESKTGHRGQILGGARHVSRHIIPLGVQAPPSLEKLLKPPSEPTDSWCAHNVSEFSNAGFQTMGDWKMTRGGIPGAVRSEGWEPCHFTLKERPSVTLSPKKHSLLNLSHRHLLGPR